jgi:hypothetical protein
MTTGSSGDEGNIPPQNEIPNQTSQGPLGESELVREIDPSEPGRSRSFKFSPEATRSHLAKSLVYITAFVIVAGVVFRGYEIWAEYYDKKVNEQATRELLGLLLSPVTTLTGSALGYYFGQLSGRDDD